jgi:hypothetical protein
LRLSRRVTLVFGVRRALSLHHKDIIMAFRKMVRAAYPPRLWSLVGYPGAGKSSFAARMHGPMVVVDADHRFQEVLSIAQGEVYELSDTKSDNVDPNIISRLLNSNMPGSDAKTIVVDSLTAIITPIVVQAMIDHDHGKERNLSAAFRNKALAMRQLQDAVTRWGCDVLWIYHLMDARDARANEVTRATVSQTEIARLTRSINVQLEIVHDKNDHDRRGIKVVWARRGRSGMVIWDESGTWENAPELIEEAVYAGLSQEEQERLEKTAPDYFPNPETAISWAMEQSAYENIPHARNAYDKLKRDRKPKNAKEMAHMWVEYVQDRLARMELDSYVEQDHDQEDHYPVDKAAPAPAEPEPVAAAEPEAPAEEVEPEAKAPAKAKKAKSATPPPEDAQDDDCPF